MEFVIHQGDVIHELRKLPSESVHCVVTSPPYWGLRNYGIEPSIWGGRSSCAHVWGSQERGKRGDVLPSEESSAKRLGTRDVQHGANDGGRFCQLCGAWRGCLGLEPTPLLFEQHMVEVFQHVRRVLHPRGTLWLNLGDCYVTHPHGEGASTDPKYSRGRDRSEGDIANRKTADETGLKSKDMVMIPARVALALQGDGWYLRSQIPWLKRNGMPESTIDRPTSMVEYVFLFSKSEDYFYDRFATLTAASLHSHPRGTGVNPKAKICGNNSRIHVDRDPRHQSRAAIKSKQNRSFSDAVKGLVESRIRRNSDWFFESWQGLLADNDGNPIAMVVNPQPFSIEMCTRCQHIYDRRLYRRLDKKCEKCAVITASAAEACVCGEESWVRVCECGATSWLSHFATFPEKMVEPCVLAGTSAHGACPLCGSFYKRIVTKPELGDWNRDPSHKHRQGAANGVSDWAKRGGPIAETLGWRPTCSHPLFPAEPVPCTVLDPFAGSGRTGFVANRFGRKFIGVDANPNYVRMAYWQHERSNQARSAPTATEEVAI